MSNSINFVLYFRDEKNNKNESKSATCILPQLCTNSRRVVLSFEAAYIAERANEIFVSTENKYLQNTCKQRFNY